MRGNILIYLLLIFTIFTSYACYKKKDSQKDTSSLISVPESQKSESDPNSLKNASEKVSILINSNPPGANISLNSDNIYKKTPLRLLNVKKGGKYLIELALEGYKPATRKIVATQNMTLDVFLDFKD